ncbi:MAG: fructosamine kinase family protein [Paludibacter sp.]|nr:fructosamine kinase family protein [Paludibacter sp.]
MTDKLKQNIENILQEKIMVFPCASGELKTDSGKKCFLKTGAESITYTCEAHGLNELKRANVIDVVNPVAFGENFILTEFVERGQAKADFFENFGKKLAALHRFRGEEFGFYEDNFIGANVQPNFASGEEKTNWTAFYFNKRLLFQYKLAEKNRLISDSLRNNFRKLENKIDKIIGPTDELPVLLHGDLWSGNYLCNKSGAAVLIDPAVYYGHREADLAMTKLFGGFSPAFYRAYQLEYPLESGWEYREGIYKLYHVLNHLNIFGHGYLPDAEWILKKYVE